MRTQTEIARHLAWERARNEIAQGRRTRSKSWGGKPRPKAERKSKPWKCEA